MIIVSATYLALIKGCGSFEMMASVHSFLIQSHTNTRPARHARRFVTRRSAASCGVAGELLRKVTLSRKPLLHNGLQMYDPRLARHRFHYDAFHERVKELVRGHDQVPRFLPDETLEKERFEEKEVADDEIVDNYLEHYRHLRKMIRIDQLITKDPDRALLLVLEIIHRGQNYNFESYDLFSPLWDLLRRHGEVIIDRIEREAPSSVMLRRCLWKMKLSQEKTPPQYRIA
jgi:hypothetical protein